MNERPKSNGCLTPVSYQCRSGDTAPRKEAHRNRQRWQLHNGKRKGSGDRGRAGTIRRSARDAGRSKGGCRKRQHRAGRSHTIGQTAQLVRSRRIEGRHDGGDERIRTPVEERAERGLSFVPMGSVRNEEVIQERASAFLKVSHALSLCVLDGRLSRRRRRVNNPLSRRRSELITPCVAVAVLLIAACCC